MRGRFRHTWGATIVAMLSGPRSRGGPSGTAHTRGMAFSYITTLAQEAIPRT